MKYIDAWKRSIDAHLQIFSNATVGVGLHNATGSQGYENETVVSYSSAQQMDVAEEIRDYFLQRHVAEKGVRGVVRNCGLSDSASLWGDPDRIDDKPASNFTALQWDVRDSAWVGYESGSVSSINGTDGVPRSVDEFATLIHNGITGYGRYLEIKVPDIVSNPPPHLPYAPYQPVFEQAARILSNARLYEAAINSNTPGSVYWNAAVWGDPTNAPISGNNYIHDDSSPASLLGLGVYGSFAGDSLRLDAGTDLYSKGNGSLGGTLVLNGGRWSTRSGGVQTIDGVVDVTADSEVLLVDGGIQLNGAISGTEGTTLTLQNWSQADRNLVVNSADHNFPGTFRVKDSGLNANTWTVQFGESYTNAALRIEGQKNDPAYAAIYQLTGDIAFREVQMPDGQGGVVNLALGTYAGFSLEAAGVSSNYYADFGGTITVGAPDKYAVWAAGWGENIGSWTNDYDGDGVVNLCEYAFDGTPNDSEKSGGAPMFEYRNGAFEYLHLKRTNDQSLAYILESTDDLTDGGWALFLPDSITTGFVGGAFVSVTNLIPVAGDKRFIRLKIERE
jgi:hypothetical protein